MKLKIIMIAGLMMDMDAFNNWLQCYYQDGMNNLVDHNGRTIWFKGPAGPLKPTKGRFAGKSRGKIFNFIEEKISTNHCGYFREIICYIFFVK